eukprot:scaffold184_cov316-Pinguiococcus_pyrenoidosus.AAC.36
MPRGSFAAARAPASELLLLATAVTTSPHVSWLSPTTAASRMLGSARDLVRSLAVSSRWRGIIHGDIASLEPSIGRKLLRRRLRVAPVTQAEDLGPLQLQRAGFAGHRRRALLLVDHAHLHAWEGLANIAWQARATDGIAERHAHFRHAISFQQRVPCQLPPLLKHGLRQRCGAAHHQPDASQAPLNVWSHPPPCSVEGNRFKQLGIDRRHRHEHCQGRLRLRDALPDARWICSASAELHGGPRPETAVQLVDDACGGEPRGQVGKHQRRPRHRYDTMDVMQGEEVQNSVGIGPLPGLHQRSDLRGDVAMRVQHALGTPLRITGGQSAETSCPTPARSKLSRKHLLFRW